MMDTQNTMAAPGVAVGECVKAFEVLTNNLVRQLGLEMVHGLGVMRAQAEEVVAEVKGSDEDVVSTLAEALEAVPQWSQTLIVEETKRIVTNRPMLPTLNAANCVAGTQVLFSIRPFDFRGDDRGAFELKTPDMSMLVHVAYIILAEILVPFIKENGHCVPIKTLREMCFDAVREAIEQTLPVNDIIRYLLGEDAAHITNQLNKQFSQYTNNKAAIAEAPPAALDAPHEMPVSRASQPIKVVDDHGRDGEKEGDEDGEEDSHPPDDGDDGVGDDDDATLSSSDDSDDADTQGGNPNESRVDMSLPREAMPRSEEASKKGFM